MSFAARAYITMILGLGLASIARGVYLGGFHDPARFVCYLSVASVVSCLKVRLPGYSGTMSLLFLFLLTGIVELSLIETIVIGIAASLAQSLWHAQVRPRAVQIAFSFANISFATTAAELAYNFSGLPNPFYQPGFRLALAGSAFFVCNTFPVAAVIALTERKSVRQIWVQFYAWSFPYYLVGAGIVGMYCFSRREFDWQVWLLLAPLVYVIYRSYHQYLKRLEVERREAEEQRQHAVEVARLHSNTEAALAASVVANAKLDAVIQSSPLAIIGFDRQGAVTLWNSGAERMYGWTSQEVLGRSPVLHRESDGDKFLDAITAMFSGDIVSGLEVTQARKDGSSFDAALWTAALETGTSTAALVTVADISDRKRLEEQLRTSQKMEAVGRLAGGVAHDFNNLLTVINGYGSMLVEQLTDNPYARNQAEEITEAGNRAAEMVSQLLTFSRRQLIKPQPILVNRLVENLHRMLGRVIGEHIQFRTVLDDNAGMIIADQNQIEAALMNLVSNARDAMPEGGVLTIETSRVLVARSATGDMLELPDGDYVRFVVRDTGKGMDLETQQHLFEPFYTTKEKGKGTGLGLPSVYGGVQQNGGRIFFSTEVGKGTAFSIYLPAIDGITRLEPTADQVQAAVRGSETILLVEDEAALRRMLREALKTSGYRVYEASNGAEAIERWSDQLEKIDLLVTDIVMPVMSGLKLAAELQRRSPRLSVIYMSGYSDEMISRQDVLGAAVQFLPKPFLPDVLVFKVRDTLDRAANGHSTSHIEQAR